MLEGEAVYVCVGDWGGRGAEGLITLYCSVQAVHLILGGQYTS